MRKTKDQSRTIAIVQLSLVFLLFLLFLPVSAESCSYTGLYWGAAPCSSIQCKITYPTAGPGTCYGCSTQGYQSCVDVDSPTPDCGGTVPYPLCEACGLSGGKTFKLFTNASLYYTTSGPCCGDDGVNDNFADISSGSCYSCNAGAYAGGVPLPTCDFGGFTDNANANCYNDTANLCYYGSSDPCTSTGVSYSNTTCYDPGLIVGSTCYYDNQGSGIVNESNSCSTTGCTGISNCGLNTGGQCMAGYGCLNSPTNLTAAATKNVTLNWTDNSNFEQGFKLERNTTEIVVLGANAITYTDSNVTEGVNYCYRIRTYKDTTNSDYSNVTCITVPDTTPPTLTYVHIASNNTGNSSWAKVGHKITVSITASENIQTPNVTIATHAATVSGSGSSYNAIYVVATSDTEGAIPFKIVFADLTGNRGTNVTTTTDSSSVSFDKTSPTVSITYNSSANFFRAGQTLKINATFTESGSGIDETSSKPQITITTAGNGDIPPTNMAKLSNLNWYYSFVLPSGSDDDGNFTVSITAKDKAGNSVTATSSSKSIDNTAPTGSSSTLANQHGPIYLNGTASDSLSGIASVTLLSINTINGVSDWTPISGTTVWFTSNATTIADGYYSATIKINDLAGNTVYLNPTTRIDNTRPTGTSTTLANQRNKIYLNGTATDNGGSGVANVTITATNTTGGLSAWSSVTGTTTWFTTNATTIPDGFYYATIRVTDATTNTFNFNATTRIDNTAPTVSITYNSTSGYFRAGQTLKINATFTESGSGIDETIPPNITITTAGNGDISATNMTKVSNLDWYYDFTIPSGSDDDGNFTVSITAKDKAGNSVTATSSSKSIDNTAPSGTSTTSANQRNIIYLNGTASDTRSGIASVTLLSSNTTGGVSDWTAISGTTTWFASNATTIADGYYQFTIRVADAAGNIVYLNPTTRIDNTSPTGASTTLPNQRNTIYLNGTASDNGGSGVSQVSINATNTTGGVSDWTAISGTTTWFASNATTIPDGFYYTTIKILDSTNNTFNFNTTTRIDNTPPILLISYNSTDAYFKENQTVRINATFTESGSGIDETSPPNLTITTAGDGDTSTNLTKLSNLNWYYDFVIPSGSDDDGNFTVLVSAKDLAGNSVNQFDSSKSIDNTAPTVSITYNSTSGYLRAGQTLRINASFNESGSGIDEIAPPQSVIVTIGDGGASGNLTKVNNTIWYYDFTIPSGSDDDGTFNVTVSATDLVSNSVTSADSSKSIDNTAPTGASTTASFQDGVVYLNGTANDTGSGVSTVTITATNTTGGVSDWTAVTGTTTWFTTNATTIPDGFYYATIRVTDTAGNIFDFNATTRIDNTPPTGTSTTLANQRNTIYLNGTATDNGGSGIAQVTINATNTSGGVSDWSGVTGTTTWFTTNATTIPDGFYYATIRVTDAATNTFDFNATTRIDNTAPTISIIYNSTANFFRAGQTLRINATFNESGSGIYETIPPNITISTSGNGDASGNLTKLSNLNWYYDFTIPSGADDDGTFNVTVSATDLVSNSVTSADSSKSIDNTAPTGASTTAPFQDGIVYLNGTANDTTSGVALVSITATNTTGGLSDWSSISGTTTWYASNATTIPEGFYYATIRVTDLVGNTFDFNTTTRIDNAPPTGASTTLTNQRNTIYLNGTANDTSSGVSSVSITATNATGGVSDWTAISGTTTWFTTNATTIPDGFYYATIRVTDAATNTFDFNATTRIDNTAPTISIIYNSTANFFRAGQTLRINATFNESGSGIYETIPPNITISTSGNGDASGNLTKVSSLNWYYDFVIPSGSDDDGNFTVSIAARDLVGNGILQSDSSKSIDNTAPSGASTTAPFQDGIVYLNGTANDTGSGVNAVTLIATNTTGGLSAWSSVTGTTIWFSTNTTSIPEGYYYVTIRVADAVGNTFDFNATTQIDNVPPTTSDSGTDTNWHSTPVSVILTCVDAVSGCSITYYCVDQSGSCVPAAVYASNITVSTTGINYVRFYSVDGAGNPESIKNATNTVKFDGTPPTGGSIGGLPYVTNSVNLTLTNSTDSESGIATIVLQRANATLASDSCGSFGNWTDLGTNLGPSFVDSLTGGLCYNYRLNSSNTVGLSNTSAELQIKSDTASPAPVLLSPANTTYSSGAVLISYSPGEIHTVPATQYSLDGTANVTLIGDTVVSFEQGQHTLTLYVTDSVSNLGSQSVVFTINITSGDFSPPTQVTGLTAANLSNPDGGELRLSWNASTDDVGVSYYNVYRSNFAFTSVQFLAPLGTSASLAYTDNGLTNGQIYYYAVTAVDSSGNENKTVVALAAVPWEIVPPIISEVTVSDLTHDSAIITWTTNEPATSVVYYGLNSSDENSSTGTTGTSHRVALVNLTNSTTYLFKASSTDSYGNTVNSTDFSFATDFIYVNDSLSIPANSSVLINATTANITATIELTTNTTVNGTLSIIQGNETSVNSTLENQTAATAVTYIDINSTLNSSALTSIVLTFYYTDEELAALGIDEASLLIYWFNETSGEWIPLNGPGDPDFVLATGQNTTANYVWANVTHFSSYSLGGKKANGLSCTSAASCSSGSCVHGTCRSGSYYSGDGFCDSGETCSNSADCGGCGFLGSGGGGGGSRLPILLSSFFKVNETKENVTGGPYGNISFKSAAAEKEIELPLETPEEPISNLTVPPRAEAPTGLTGYLVRAGESLRAQLPLVLAAILVLGVLYFTFRSPNSPKPPTKEQPKEIDTEG